MKEADLELLKKLVAQPSISAQNQGVRRCAELLKELLTETGCSNVTIFETPGQPVVYGELASKKEGAKTVIFYGHYDVQPPEPLEEWITPPFEPTVRDGRLYGCGTADNKGQFLAHILAVRSFMKAEGGVPVNVKFVLDGEEESGSPHMEGFVESHRDLLKADLIYNSDGPMHSLDFPEIKQGYRGVMSFELELTTATHQNHSKTGGLIRNPAMDLVQLIATMADSSGRVTIDGFYDDVLPPTEYEQKLMDQCGFDPEELARVYGVKKLAVDSKEAYYRQLMFLPTLTINGLCSGYYGVGHKTCVPRSALAKFDIRLVEKMDPKDIERKIRRHVAAVNPDVQVRVDGSTLPSKTSAELPLCRAVAEAVKVFYPGALVLPSSGGSNPDYVWTKILKIPSVGVPYGNADQTNHSPNENFRLDCFYRGIHVSAEVMDRLSRL